jgi:aminoglycoside phosphotransferase (APT) family kinase protein
MRNLVEEICRREKIRVESINPLMGGQINQVFLVNHAYVVRIGMGEAASTRLQQETALLQSLEEQICVPKVFALGQYEDCTYQIQVFINGQKLYWVWKDLSAEQKDRIMEELAGYLKVLHQRTCPGFGSLMGEKTHPSWRDFCAYCLECTLDELKRYRVKLDPAVVELVRERFERDQEWLCEGTPCLIHRDLWLGNILVEGGRITAILDFEFSMYAPADYELLLVEEFCLYPNDFAEGGKDIFSVADFADVLGYLNKHYPGMFSFQNLRKRLDLYHLIYALSSYLEWGKTQPKDFVDVYPLHATAKALNFLFEHGTRLYY